MKIAIKFNSQGDYQSHCTDSTIVDLKQVVPNNEGFEFYEISKEQLTNIRYLKLAAGEITIDESAKQADIAKFEIAKKISENKIRLSMLSQDIIQALAGETVPELSERKEEFIQLHNEVRILEGKEPRAIEGEIL